MKKRFGTKPKAGHNTFSVYEEKGSCFISCEHVKGDVDYVATDVGISRAEYNELYEAYLLSDETDNTLNIIRNAAGYLFWRRTK